MPRALKNTLTEAEHLDRIAQFTGHDGQDIMSRYGADLIGRAIGHEMAHDRAKGLPDTMFYSNLIHTALDGAAYARKVLAFDGARDILRAL